MMVLPIFYFNPRRPGILTRTTIFITLVFLGYKSHKSWSGADLCEYGGELQPQSYTASSDIHIASVNGTLPMLVDHFHHHAQGSGPGQSNRLTDNLGHSLRRTLSLLPNKARIKELLAPLDMTGTDRIHEMILRVRSFKELFEAWEDLHFIWTKEGPYTIDVVQALYDNPSLTKDLGIDIPQAIHGYETLRFVLSKMSMLLFPWSMPMVGDHVDMHARAYNSRRGIVIAAGNKQASYLLTLIPSIRWLGCDLPIEIMYLGDEDLSPSFQADLKLLPGVTTRDLSLMVNDDGWKLAGWAAKPFSILFSSFREVILMDADVLFFVNPEILFDDTAYKDTGTLFFRDRLFMPESKKGWLKSIMPDPPSSKIRESRFWTGESGHMQESGVVIVDKWRHFIALLMVAKLNGPDRDTRDGHQGIYEMVYGDKETYWLGWEAVGDTDYAFHGGDAGTMGPIKEIKTQQAQDTWTTINNVHEIDTATICAPQLLHLDLNDRPIWFNGWLLPNKFKDQDQEYFGYFEAYLKEPRSIRDASSWQLRDSNICCLTSEYLFTFSEHEKTVINMIINTWHANRRE